MYSPSHHLLLVFFFLVVRRFLAPLLEIFTAAFADSGDTIDTRGLLDFETFYPTDPRNSDRPAHESLR